MANCPYARLGLLLTRALQNRSESSVRRFSVTLIYVKECQYRRTKATTLGTIRTSGSKSRTPYCLNGGLLLLCERASEGQRNARPGGEALHTTKEAYAITVTMVVGWVLEPGLRAHAAL